MRRLFREIGRAPVRILVSVIALALAVGAIGVFAIPTVATASLRDAAERDGVPDVILHTTPTGDLDVAESLGSIDDVVAAEPQVLVTAPIGGPGDRSVDVLGLDLAGQTMDRVQVVDGRLPSAPGEVLATPDTATIGSTLDLVRPDGSSVDVEVVGTGRTSFWAQGDLLFTGLDTAADIGSIDGANRLVVRAAADDADTLAVIVDAARDELAADEVSFTAMPVEIVGGRHPIEADIEQISTLIGMLGVVAGLVGLVLLASTTNTLVVERSREVAVMRALGATDREVRRRLRRIALSMAAAATLIGLPLGIAISYVIARMVLQEFIGLTPGFAVSWPVLGASALFALVGARLVAARSARRVTRRPLAESLRDRDAVPFGSRRTERAVVRWTGGRLTDRLALRNAMRSRGRSAAISLQLAAAVAALMIVASMATTINDFNAAELEPVRWGSTTWVAGPGLDIDADVADGDPRTETAIEVEGEAVGWQIDVHGWEPETLMIDRSVAEGRWFEGPNDAVVSKGFADRVGLEVGDRVEVGLASGTTTFEVVGLHRNAGRRIYLERDALAEALGGAGLANRVVSLDAELDRAIADRLGGVTGGATRAALDEDDSGRAAVLVVFGAIGVVVVSVAGLAVMSGLGVNLHERRHELAAMRAVGARRRDVFGALATEVVALAVVGVGVGLFAGFHGGRAIARSFESSNAVEIGFTFADRAIPVVIGVVLLLGATITLAMVRRADRRPIAGVLRGAA